MNTDKMRQAGAIVAADANEVRQKRLWIKPMFSIEDASRTAASKISNPVEVNMPSAIEGPTS